MKILVSFCNQHGDDKRSNLVHIDTESDKVEEVGISIPNMGIHGIDMNQDYIFCIYRADDPGIVILDAKTRKEILHQPLNELSDPHGVSADGADFIITSTGNDQVIKYRYEADKSVVNCLGTVWSPDGSERKSDTHHINSICQSDGKIYISAFGPKKEELWSSAEDGYIYCVSDEKKVIDGIYHPHSLTVHNGEYYYCDSSRRRVMQKKEQLVVQKAGYTRGLDVSDDVLVVGSSNGRTKSKSTGIEGKKYTGNIADPGILQQCCRVSIYKRCPEISLAKEYDFSGERNEVFDILILEG